MPEIALAALSVPTCPLCRSDRDVLRLDLDLTKEGKVIESFYCQDCDISWEEEADLLEGVCLYPEQTFTFI